MNVKVVISLTVGGALSAVALFLAFRHVPLNDLIIYINGINYWWFIPTIGILLATFILRVFRWQLLLRETGKIPFWKAFHPLMIGFMINCILPGRIGEIARPTLLRKDSNVPISTGLATVAAERMLDIMMLILLFIAVFSNISQQNDLEVIFGSYTLSSKTLQVIAWGLIRLSILLLLVIALFAFPVTRRRMTRAIQAIARWKAFSALKIQTPMIRAADFFECTVDNFSSGLSFVHYPGRLAAIVGLTIAIWGLTAFSYYTFALGCPGIDLSMWQSTTMMVVVCFFIALPSVPGFWGLWEAGGVFALSLFGIAAKDAAGFTLVNHALQMIPVIIIGIVSALMTSVNILHLPKKKETAASLV